MPRGVRAFLLVAAVVSACGGAAGPGASMDDEFTLPSTGGPGSFPAKSLAPAARSVTGVLGFDDVEGGCAYLETADGTRYEVVYPDGWMVDRANGELRADDGRVVAAGEALTVQGNVATDRSSTCQTGPMFVATAVEAGSR